MSIYVDIALYLSAGLWLVVIAVTYLRFVNRALAKQMESPWIAVVSGGIATYTIVVAVLRAVGVL